MASYENIEGADELLEILSFDRRKFNAVAKKCFQEAARATAKKIRSDVPSRWKRLVKGKSYIAPDGTVASGYGLSYKPKQFNGSKPKKGEQIPDWFKAYWKNYGTLEGRDPSHQFRTPVKKSSTNAAERRRNRSGEKAENFFEDAIRDHEKTFNDAFHKAVDKRKDEFFEKKK